MLGKHSLPYVFLLIILVALPACSGSSNDNMSIHQQASSDNEKLKAELSPSTTNQTTILATTPLIADWVNYIGGERVSADHIIPYSVNTHTYVPGAKDIAKITDAQYVFAIGWQYEGPWLAKLLNSHQDIVLITLTDFISPLASSKSEDDHSLSEDDHSIHQYDPHFWFDPALVSMVVESIAEVLSNIDPMGQSYYKEKVAEYAIDLKKLDQNIVTEINRIPETKRKILTEHESLGYLGRRYNIEVLRAVIPKLSSEAGPTPKDLTSAIRLIRQHDIKVIFLEQDTNGETSQRIAEETGVRVVTGLNVENLNPDQSYIDFITYNINLIVSNLSD